MKIFKKKDGQILLELLLSIGIIIVVVGLGAQVVYVSMTSNRLAGERDAALGLVDGTLEAVKNIAMEKWQNIFNLTKNVQYSVIENAGKWAVNSGSDIIVLNGINYTRYFIVQNACRDSSKNVTGITDSAGTAITCTSSGGSFDPSTQKLTTTVSWPDAEPIYTEEYITRWRNEVCAQTDWAVVGSGVKNCPNNTYESASNIDFGTSGSLKIGP